MLKFLSVSFLILFLFQASVLSAQISGTVTTPEGTPITGAFVGLYHHDNGPIDSSISNADGKFLFSNLNEGSYNLWAAVPDLTTVMEGADDNRIIANIKDDKSISLNIILKQINSLTVTFKAPEGQKSEFFGVIKNIKGYVPMVPMHFISRDTCVLTGIEPGEATYEYSLSGYDGGTFTTSVGLMENKKITIQLTKEQKQRCVKGVVYSASGTPLGNVGVSGSNFFSQINEDGTFSSCFPNGEPMKLRLDREGYPDTAIEVSEQDLANDLRIILREGINPIEGTITGLTEAEIKECQTTFRAVVNMSNPEAIWAIQNRSSLFVSPDAHGLFKAYNLTAPQYELSIICSGYHHYRDTVQPGQLLGNINLDQAIVFKGKITDEVTGAAITEFALEQDLKSPENSDGGRYSGQLKQIYADGVFELNSMITGDNCFCIHTSEYLSKCVTFNTADKLPALTQIILSKGQELTIQAAGASNYVKGAIITLKQKSKSGVYSRSAKDYNAETNSDGEAKIKGLKPGKYTLNASHIDFLDLEQEETIEESKTINIYLDMGYRISGSIKSRDNNLFADCVIIFKPTAGSPRRSNLEALITKGTFESPILDKGLYKLVLFQRLKSRQLFPVYIFPEAEAGSRNLQLETPAIKPWSFTIKGINGQILSDPKISCVMIDTQNGEPDYSAYYSGSVIEKSKIYAVAGSKYKVQINAKGYLPLEKTITILKDKGQQSNTIQLQKAPRLKGHVSHYSKVFDPSQYQVELLNGKGNGTTANIEKDGKFYFDEVPVGGYHISIRRKPVNESFSFLPLGFTGNLTEDVIYTSAGYSSSQSGKSSISIKKPGIIQGNVLDYNNRAVPSCPVILAERVSLLYDINDHKLVGLALSQTDKNGKFIFPNVPPGHYNVCLINPIHHYQSVGVKSDQTSDITFTLPKGKHDISVRFDMPNVAPKQNYVYLEKGLVNHIVTKPGEHPDEVVFSGMPDGRYAITAFTASSSPNITHNTLKIIDIKKGKTNFNVYVPGRGFRFKVTDEGHNSLGGVLVRVTRQDSTLIKLSKWGDFGLQLNYTTDINGNVEFFGLDSGNYNINFHHPHMAKASLRHNVSSKEVMTSLKVTMKPAANFSLLVNYDNMPFSGALVYIYDSTDILIAMPRSASTDVNGVYNSTALLPGKYKVTVMASFMAHANRQLLVMGTQPVNLTINLIPGGYLEVTGDKIRYKRLYLKNSSGKIRTLTDKGHRHRFGQAPFINPSILFDGLIPDKYQVYTDGSEYPLGSATVKAGEISLLQVN